MAEPLRETSCGDSFPPSLELDFVKKYDLRGKEKEEVTLPGAWSAIVCNDSSSETDVVVRIHGTPKGTIRPGSNQSFLVPEKDGAATLTVEAVDGGPAHGAIGGRVDEDEAG